MLGKALAVGQDAARAMEVAAGQAVAEQRAVQSGRFGEVLAGDRTNRQDAADVLDEARGLLEKAVEKISFPSN